jgi:CheY-like chemotaxis protein
MKQHRILVVDDETDVRRVIKLTLSRDPELTVRTCACGQTGLAEAASWAPDLILLDVMMPDMDGPTTLAHLQENPATAPIPVVFLTARARRTELAHFISLGARGAIAKPFVPTELRAAINGHLQGVCAPRPKACADDARAKPLLSETERRAERADYLDRLQTTVARLIALLAALREEPTSAAVLNDLRTVAHRTAGSAGLFGFDAVSAAAARLEDAIIARHAGEDAHARIDVALVALLSAVGREHAMAYE